MKYKTLPKLNHQQRVRFWRTINIPEVIDVDADGGGCWEATTGINNKGYSAFGVCRDRFFSHRIAWSLANDSDPGDNLVRHLCDNPLCCNPVHLAIGSHKDNMKDIKYSSLYIWRMKNQAM